MEITNKQYMYTYIYIYIHVSADSSGVWDQYTTPTTSTLYITNRKSGGVWGGKPVRDLHTHPHGADSRRGGWDTDPVFEGSPTRNIIFHRLTPFGPSNTGPVLLENQWKSLNTHGNHWNSMEIQWTSLKINKLSMIIIKYHWKTMKINEHQ